MSDIPQPGEPLEIKNWRKTYRNEQQPFLDENKMDLDPFIQFDLWFKDVSLRKDVTFEEINAVSLATCLNNKPSVRMVLLKKYSADGFCFYTNYNSRKGQELLNNPFASICFYWPFVSRQVRIEGFVEQMSSEDADEYWNERPMPSRIGSKASHQGKVVKSRQDLEDEKKRLEKLVEEEGPNAVTRPPEWQV